METLDYLVLILCLVLSIGLIAKLLGIFYTFFSLMPSSFLSGSQISKLLGRFRSKKGNITHLRDSLEKEKSILNNELSDFLSFKVFCASERSLSKLFNLIPWESSGILKFDGSDIHFNGIRYRPKFFHLKSKTIRVKYRFPRNQVKISYLPSRFMRDGGLSWMKMEVHNRRFYFTSGRQNRLAKNRQVTTQDIYEIVTDI
jgi:hypothetical protein